MGQVTGSVVGEQPCTQEYVHPVHAGLSQGDLQGLLHIPGVHRGDELPGQDAARVVIQNSGQVVAAPV